MFAEKRAAAMRSPWIGALAAVGLIVLLAASPVTTSPSHQTAKWNGPKASPDTLVLTPVSKGLTTELDYIYVTNTTGGTATNANVAVWRYNGSYTGTDTTLDTLVVWQGKAMGGPLAAPALGVMLAPPGGIYKSRDGDTLKVIVTMASASSLYVSAGYHHGR